MPNRPPSTTSLRSYVILANIVVLCVVTAVVGLQARADRQQVLDEAGAHTLNLANALAEHSRQTLATIDLGLRGVAQAVREAPPGTQQAALLHESLAQRQAVSAATFAFFVLDQDGRLAATSRTPRPDPVDLSEYPEFKVHATQAGNTLYIGPPRKGRIGFAAGRWIVNVTRRIDHPDGRFAGVAAASVSLDQMLSFYDALRLGRDGVVGLYSPEGLLIVRSPFVEDYVGRDFGDHAIFREVMSRKERGLYRSTYSTDGITRLSAFRRVADGSAIVYVGVGQDEVLAPWRDRLMVQAGIGALAVLMFAGASVIALAYITRRQAWERQRSMRLQAIADASTRLVRAPDIDGVLRQAADSARSLIGAHHAVASLTSDEHLRQAGHAVSVSDRYAAQPPVREPGDAAGLHRLVCETNQPVCLTREQVHPHWTNLPTQDPAHPSLRGWQAVPLASQDGHNLGLIQLSDKIDGDFTSDDLHELTQLASIASSAVESLLSRQSREIALAQAHAARERIQTIFESISDAVYALDEQWRFIHLNNEAQRLLRRSREELLGQVVWDAFPETVGTVLHEHYHRARAQRTVASFEFHYPPLDTWFAVRAFPHDGGLTVYFQDVTRKVELDAKLRQSQKMDALGHLTGGVAHDFNNLLTVILGAADAMDEHLPQAPADLARQATLIRQAGERAAALTHRLLAFARKQPLDPRQTNLNELLGDFEALLRRTLGENIDIELVRGSGLWRALVDPNELQNAVLNLAINARDAMPEGGRLTIETANMAVDADYAQAHDIRPGQYVLVAVSDTGHGMSSETAAKAFDPFFTTKGPGHGSGLGLSMVYGFVRQSHGHVKIYSEPGLGTTVKIYLPRTDASVDAEYQRPERGPLRTGGEHVLLVEDDDLVRLITLTSLHKLGYTVTECADGAQAVAHLASETHFDLLLTDVVLAGGLSGKQVAQEAARLRPGMRVLYMSGYTENAIVHHGRLDRGVHLLGKPFRLDELGRKLREVLDS